MDRLRPMLDSQKSMSSPTASGSPMSTMSPMHRHVRSSSSGLANMKKPQNVAAKAAAQRLAQVMAQGDDEDEDEDDLLVDYGSTGSLTGLGLAAGRSGRPRSRSPKLVRPAVTEQPPIVRTPMSTRPSFSVRSSEQPLPRPSSATRLSQSFLNTMDQTPSAGGKMNYNESTDFVEERTLMSGRPLSVRTGGHSPARSNSSLRPSLSGTPSEQPPSARSVSAGRSPVSMNPSDLNLTGRSSMSFNPSEQPPSARSASAGRPSGIKTVPMVPSAVTISLKQPAPSSPAYGSRSNKRMSLDFGSMKIRESKEPETQLSSTALQDELDMLQEENDNLLDKLRFTEERFQEAEARAKLLEKQVATLGEGVSMEARLLSRKEAALQQREAALRVASQKHGGQTGGIAALRTEAESARDEATSALEQLQESESEVRSLRSMVQRLLLTQEEMEEVVLKRCWLARYWGLCVRYGIYPDIAEAKYDYWSSFAPLPLEIVIAAGQKAKEDNISVNSDMDEKQASELSGEGTAESMLIVEKGLRELSMLKVEDAIRVAMAHHRRRNMQKPAFTDDLRSPSQKFVEAFELSSEEAEDVQFKQAWLMYFWRRAVNHDLELDIAEERLHSWINHSTRASTSHDAVDVERGLIEIRKLGIETQLWEETRRWLEQDSQTRRQTDF